MEPLKVTILSHRIETELFQVVSVKFSRTGYFLSRHSGQERYRPKDQQLYQIKKIKSSCLSYLEPGVAVFQNLTG